MSEPTYLELANALLIRALDALSVEDNWYNRSHELIRDIERFMDDTK